MSIHKYLLVVDTETGGLDPDKHCIIELAARVVTVLGSRVRVLPEHFYTRLVPDRPVTPEAAEVNGWTDDGWNSHPDTEARHEALARFIDWCALEVPDGAMWCGANIGFDLGFLQGDLKREGLSMPSHLSYRKVDTESLAFPLYAAGVTPGIGLKHLRRWSGCEGEQKHRAMDDVDDVIHFLKVYLPWALYGGGFGKTVDKVRENLRGDP